MFLAAEGPDRLEDREREYIRALYLDHYQALRSYVCNLRFTEDAAEDWLQETFLIAMRRVEALRACRSPRAYLIQILRNVIGYHLRSMKYASELAAKLWENPEEYRDEPDPETLYRGLLSDRDLQLLLRFYLEGRSQKELAWELGIEVGALHMRLQRAKAHLKAAMRRDGLV